MIHRYATKITAARGEHFAMLTNFENEEKVWLVEGSGATWYSMVKTVEDASET